MLQRRFPLERELYRAFVYPLVRLISWITLQFAGPSETQNSGQRSSSNQAPGHVVTAYRVLYPVTRWIPLSRSGRSVIAGIVAIPGHLGSTVGTLCLVLFMSVALGTALLLCTNRLSGMSMAQARTSYGNLTDVSAASAPVLTTEALSSAVLRTSLSRDSGGSEIARTRQVSLAAISQSAVKHQEQTDDAGGALHLGIELLSIGAVLTSLGIIGLRAQSRH